MRNYIVSIDSAAWRFVLEEWTEPTVEEKGVTRPKPIGQWTDDEHKEATLNGKALFAINCAVDNRERQRITSCKTTFEAWGILETAHGGTTEVKESRL